MTTDQIYERLVPIFSQMNKSVTCQSVTINPDGTYTMLCSYTKWAIPGFEVTILNDQYSIISVESNVNITLSGPVTPAVLTFDLFTPVFKHGSMINVAKELSNLPALSDRMPLIWLQDVMEEKQHLNELDAIDSDADCKLYFLCPADFPNWSIEDGDQKGIKPMRAMWNEFLKVLSVSQYVGELTGVANLRNYSNFGVITDKGAVRNIFNEPLCGVMSRITIPFYKECDCCSGSPLDNRPAPGYVLDQSGNILAILYSNEKYTVTTGPCAGVDIEDQDGNILTTVPSGGTYQVTVLTEIEDTITANSATIIENLT